VDLLPAFDYFCGLVVQVGVDFRFIAQFLVQLYNKSITNQSGVWAVQHDKPVTKYQLLLSTKTFCNTNQIQTSTWST